MLSTLASGGLWNPLRLPGLLAWFNANPAFVAVTGADVDEWRSRASDASVLTGGVATNLWMSDGWGSGVPAIDFGSGAGGAMSGAAVGLVAPGNGTDLPFSLFVSIRQTALVDNTTIVCWQSGGSSLSSLQMLNSGSGLLRYQRSDSGATSVNVDGTLGMGFVKRRIGLIFSGTSAQIYQNRLLEASGACDVGALACDTFKIGSGPGIDSFDGIIADVVVLNRAASVAEYLAYEEWSRRALGV